MTKSNSSPTKLKLYQCLCTHCNNNWKSLMVPTECPKCKWKGITYREYDGIATFRCTEPNCGHSWSSNVLPKECPKCHSVLFSIVR